MASSGINFSNLTAPNGAVEKLRELVFLAIQQEESLGGQVTFMGNQKDGKKVGFLGGFGLLGVAAQGCDPTYGSDLIKTSEQTWDINAIEIAEAICFADIENALIKEAAKRKTSVDDLTGTEYFDEIIAPLIEQAFKSAMSRYAWFGDKAMTSAGMKVSGHEKYFTATDGLWKHLFANVTAGTTKRVTVAANAQNTVAAQKSAIKGAGVATGIIEEMIFEAPAVLRQQAGLRVYMSQGFADALTLDYRHNNKGSDLQWNALADGIKTTQYAGVEIVAMPAWDAIIESELKNTTNVNANMLPYRAVLTIKDNLLAGSESENEAAEIDFNFDHTSRKNTIYVKDTLGTMVAQPDLAIVAY